MHYLYSKDVFFRSGCLYVYVTGLMICSTNNQKLSCVFPERIANASELLLYFKSGENITGTERNDDPYLCIVLSVCMSKDRLNFSGV